jgi:hypothetical protein
MKPRTLLITVVLLGLSAAAGTAALGKPVRVIVSADRAYVVASVVYTFKQKGVAMRESAQVVCALQKGSAGWLIAGWTWVGTAPKPAAGASN